MFDTLQKIALKNAKNKGVSKENFALIYDDNWHFLQIEALSWCAALGMCLSCYISDNPHDFETESGYFNYDTELTTIIKEGLQFKADIFNHTNGFIVNSVSIKNEVILDFKDRLVSEFEGLLHRLM
jgi:hypothetical protein